MKNLLKTLAFFLVINGAFTSCSSDDSPTGPNTNTPQVSIESAKGKYSTTQNTMGLFEISLHAAELDFKLNFISDQVADADLLEAKLKSENYAVSQDVALYTLRNDSYWTKDNVNTTIASGQLAVSRVGEIYTIVGTLTDSQNVSYSINFSGVIDIEPEYEVVYTNQNGWYWGDNEYDHPNVAEYMTYFSQGQTDNYGELEGDGYYLSLSFYNTMAPKAWEAKIPNQTYTASTDYAIGTFNIASQEDINNGAPYYAFASFQHNDSAAGIEKEVFITGGTIKVMDQGDDQEVRFNIELQDGSRHVGKYVGYVRQGDEYTVSTLVDDKQVGPLNYGYIEYKGQSPIAGKDNNRWNIYLLSQNVTTYPQYYWLTEGTGQYLRVTIYTENGVTTDVPAGTYPLGVEVAGNAGSGGGFEVGLDYGTWFYEMNADNYSNYAPIKTGTVTIAKNAEVYTVTVQGVDDRQNAITASYSGELAFINNSNKPAAAVQGKKVNSKKATNKPQKYNWKKNLKVSKSVKK